MIQNRQAGFFAEHGMEYVESYEKKPTATVARPLELAKSSAVFDAVS